MNSDVPLILVNTNLAAAAGGLAALSLSWMIIGKANCLDEILDDLDDFHSGARRMNLGPLHGRLNG